MSGEKRKAQVLSFIARFMDANGYAPSYREIGRAVGLRSLSSVARYMHELAQEGRIAVPGAAAGRGVSARRTVRLPKREMTHRIRLELADGGVLYLDCSVEDQGGFLSLCFTGIMDAEGLKHPVGRIVGGRIDREDA